MPLTGEVLRFFDPNVRSLAHFLADSVLEKASIYPVDPHTVPRARSGASRGKVCYRVLAASAVLVCTCSRRTLRVATSRAAAALARCSIVCRGAHALLCGQVRY